MADSYLEFEQKLAQECFNDIPALFPTLNFQHKGNAFVTNTRPDGTQGESVKLRISAKNPTMVFYNGSTFTNTNLFTLYAQVKRQERAQAINDLAQRYKLTSPYGKLTAEQRQKLTAEQATKQAKINACHTFANALDLPQAESVKTYFIKRLGVTGYENAKEHAYIGFIDKSVLAQVNKTCAGWSDDATLNNAIGNTHNAVICVWSKLAVTGYNFRTVTDTKPKYMQLANAKRNYIGYLNGTAKEITLVEGEMDAICALSNGVKNVCSIGGKQLTPEHVKVLTKQGVKAVTIIPDNDDAGTQGTIASAKVLQEAKIKTYIAPLNEMYKDVGDAIQAGDTDSVTWALQNSTRFVEWYTRQQVTAINNGTAKEQDDTLDALTNYALSCPVSEQGIITGVYADNISVMPANTLQARIDERRQAYEQGQEQERRKQILLQAIETLPTGDNRKFNSLLQQAQVNEQNNLSFEELNADVPTSLNDFGKWISDQPKGLKTGLFVTNGEETIEIELNVGITFICGKQGDGKTTMGITMALLEAIKQEQSNSDKRVLFFTYEVSKKRILTKMFCAYAHYYGRVKGEFYETGVTGREPVKFHLFPEINLNRCAVDVWNGKLPDLQKYVSQDRCVAVRFWDAMKKGFYALIQKHLCVIDLALNKGVNQFMDSCEQSIKLQGSTLIVLDYIQKLDDDAKKHDKRTEELKAIGEQIVEFAKVNLIPIIATAQFNRQIEYLQDVSNKNIGEAGDIERVAETVLGIYNLKTLPTISDSDYTKYNDTAKIFRRNMCESAIQETEELKNNKVVKHRVITSDTIRNKLYIKVLKYRDGVSESDVICDFVGNASFVDYSQTGEKIQAGKKAWEDYLNEQATAVKQVKAKNDKETKLTRQDKQDV